MIQTQTKESIKKKISTQPNKNKNKNKNFYFKNKNKNKNFYFKNKNKKQFDRRKLINAKFAAAAKVWELSVWRRNKKNVNKGLFWWFKLKDIEKRKKSKVFPLYKRKYWFYRGISIVKKNILPRVIRHTLRSTFRRFGFFRYRRYLLISAIKRRSRYFAKLKRRGRGSARWRRKKKYRRYNVREDARIFKQQLNKWITLFLDNELPLRYYFFNNLKAPLLARVLYGPFLAILGKVILLDLTKYMSNFFDYYYKIHVIFKFLNNKHLSASIILQYLLSRLSLLYLPREVIPRLMTRLVTTGKGIFRVHPRKQKQKTRPQLVKGILFKCAGRFTRAQMASYKYFKAGNVSLSTISARVKYAFGTVSLKYGSLGLKVFVVA